MQRNGVVLLPVSADSDCGGLPPCAAAQARERGRARGRGRFDRLSADDCELLQFVHESAPPRPPALDLAPHLSPISRATVSLFFVARSRLEIFVVIYVT